jgi:hypothetical protein
MLKRVTLVIFLLFSGCVTVNIYFPAAAVQRAADEIVKETWGGPNSTPERVQPQSFRPFAPDRSLSFSLPRLSRKKPISMCPIQQSGD